MISFTAEELANIFEYRNGLLYWKTPTSNRVKVGAVVGNVNGVGYREVKLHKQRMLAHRIIFCMHHGYMPTAVDHINGNKLDNTVSNLRESSVRENAYNTPKTARNTSGVKGVHWHSTAKKWAAQLSIKGVRSHLGLFESLDEAAAAVHAARVQYHGAFAHHG